MADDATHGHKLKPCPFCGGTDLVLELWMLMWVVECQNYECEARLIGPPIKQNTDARELTVARWNRRTGA